MGGIYSANYADDTPYDVYETEILVLNEIKNCLPFFF